MSKLILMIVVYAPVNMVGVYTRKSFVAGLSKSNAQKFAAWDGNGSFETVWRKKQVSVKQVRLNDEKGQ